MISIDRVTTASGINGRRTVELDHQEVILIDIYDPALRAEVTVCFASAGNHPFRRCSCEQLQGCNHRIEARKHLPEILLAFAELDAQRETDERQVWPIGVSPKKKIAEGKVIGEGLVRQALLRKVKAG
jgi:hypothetical protein